MPHFEIGEPFYYRRNTSGLFFELKAILEETNFCGCISDSPLTDGSILVLNSLWWESNLIFVQFLSVPMSHFWNKSQNFIFATFRTDPNLLFFGWLGLFPNEVSSFKSNELILLKVDGLRQGMMRVFRECFLMPKRHRKNI